MISRILGRIFDNSSGLAAGKAADSLALSLLNDIDFATEFMPSSDAVSATSQASDPMPFRRP